MSETMALTVVCGVCAALFTVLIAILGWIGNKIYSKLDAMGEALVTMAEALHEKINSIDRRVTVVETKCEGNHP